MKTFPKMRVSGPIMTFLPITGLFLFPKVSLSSSMARPMVTFEWIRQLSPIFLAPRRILPCGDSLTFFPIRRYFGRYILQNMIDRIPPTLVRDFNTCRKSGIFFGRFPVSWYMTICWIPKEKQGRNFPVTAVFIFFSVTQTHYRNGCAICSCEGGVRRGTPQSHLQG